jgi:hypothetical protein
MLVGLEAHAGSQQQSKQAAGSRQPGPQAHARTQLATAAAAMAVSLQQLKVYAEAARCDRSCLEKEYESPVPLPTRGQQISTVCRTSEEPPRTEQHEPFLPNDHGAVAVAVKSVMTEQLQPYVTADLSAEDHLASDDRARSNLGLIPSEPVQVHASEQALAHAARRPKLAVPVRDESVPLYAHIEVCKRAIKARTKVIRADFKLLTGPQLRKRVKAVVGRGQHREWMACKTHADYLKLYLAHDPITCGHVQDIAGCRERLKLLQAQPKYKPVTADEWGAAEDEGVRACGGERQPDATLKQNANLRSRHRLSSLFQDCSVQYKPLGQYKPSKKKEMARAAGATEEDINAPRPAGCERTGRKDAWLHAHLDGFILRGRARDEQRQESIALNREFAGPLIKCGGRKLRCTCQQQGACKFCCMPDASCTCDGEGTCYACENGWSTPTLDLNGKRYQDYQVQQAMEARDPQQRFFSAPQLPPQVDDGAVVCRHVKAVVDTLVTQVALIAATERDRPAATVAAKPVPVICKRAWSSKLKSKLKGQWLGDK